MEVYVGNLPLQGRFSLDIFGSIEMDIEMDNKNHKKEDDTAVVCIRCDKLNTPVTGAIIKNCDFCGAKVWLAPASQKMKFDRIYCMECFQLDFNAKEDEICYTKENIEEFNTWLLENCGYKMGEEDILEMTEKATGVKIKKIEKMDKK